MGLGEEGGDLGLEIDGNGDASGFGGAVQHFDALVHVISLSAVEPTLMPDAESTLLERKKRRANSSPGEDALWHYDLSNQKRPKIEQNQSKIRRSHE